MKIPVSDVKQAGLVVRAVRKSQAVRQDNLAGSAKVGHVFVIDDEE